MTDTWIKWLWVDCIHYGIEIFTDIMDFSVSCSGDIELMWLFVQNGCQGQDLSTLNQCWMAMRVIWLSDFCTGSGWEICNNAWEGKADSESQYQWPLCAPIGPMDWKLWQVTLQWCLWLDWWHKLQCPLGLWFPGQDGWYYEGDTDRLWQKTPNHWFLHPNIPWWLCTWHFQLVGQIGKPHWKENCREPWWCGCSWPEYWQALGQSIICSMWNYKDSMHYWIQPLPMNGNYRFRSKGIWWS